MWKATALIISSEFNLAKRARSSGHHEAFLAKQMAKSQADRVYLVHQEVFLSKQHL